MSEIHISEMVEIALIFFAPPPPHPLCTCLIKVPTILVHTEYIVKSLQAIESSAVWCYPGVAVMSVLCA